MALETLINQIKTDVQDEVDGIIDAAKSEAETIINTAKQQTEREAQLIHTRGEKQAARLGEKIKAAARHTAREHEIQVKEAMMQECLHLVKEKLKDTKMKDYEQMLRSVIKKGQQTFEDCVVITVRKNDTKIVEKLGVKVIDSKEGIGGVIVQSKDGHKQIDHTFESLLDRRMDDLRIMIAHELFDEGA